MPVTPTFWILLAALALLGWTAWRAWQALSAARGSDAEPGNPIAYEDLVELANRKRIVLSNLRETDLDYETGKVSEDHYQEITGQSAREAVALMRRLDAVRASLRFTAQVDRDLAELVDSVATQAPSEPLEPASVERDWMADVVFLDEPQEGAMSAAARMRAKLAAADRPRCPVCATELADPTDKFCGQCGEMLEATCSQCGSPLRPTAKFCSECGGPRRPTEAPA